MRHITEKTIQLQLGMPILIAWQHGFQPWDIKSFLRQNINKLLIIQMCNRKTELEVNKEEYKTLTFILPSSFARAAQDKNGWLVMSTHNEFHYEVSPLTGLQ